MIFRRYGEERDEMKRMKETIPWKGKSKGRRWMAAALALTMAFVAAPVTAFAATQTTQEMQAEVLHHFNFLEGSGAGYQLQKKPNRVEAIVMLIHMRGEDKEVLNGTFQHPFTDVPAWAQKYVGYAYEKGLSSGVSDTLFGSQRECTQAQYLTFLLRTLGYDDRNGEFSWKEPYALAKAAGIIGSDLPLRRFSRGDMVGESYWALNAKTVHRQSETVTGAAVVSRSTLKTELIGKGVFTQQVYDDAMAVYNQGPKQVKAVYLTFDDGPSTRVTPQILDTLDAYGVPATFFVLGRMVDQNPQILRREYQEGHKIATHGYSHDYKHLYSSTANLLSDIQKGNAAIDKALGFPYNNRVFRFPGGSHKKSQAMKKAVTDAGFAYYDWNSSGQDAASASGSTASEIVNSTISTIWGDTGQVIVLLHDTNAKKTTAEALPQIIKYFRDHGYEFRTL